MPGLPASGMNSLPVCVVRIRSVLRFTRAILPRGWPRRRAGKHSLPVPLISNSCLIRWHRRMREPNPSGRAHRVECVHALLHATARPTSAWVLESEVRARPGDFSGPQKITQQRAAGPRSTTHTEPAPTLIMNALPMWCHGCIRGQQQENRSRLRGTCRLRSCKKARRTPLARGRR